MFYNLLIILLIIKIVSSNFECSANNSPSYPKYHLMEKCYRSNLGVAAKANLTSLRSCHQLGYEKRGLAINFSPPEAWADGDESLQYTCEVLKCAEAAGGLTLVNDTRYDYYSLYAKPLPHFNTTCVPGIGMFFIITKKLNYTQAVSECSNITSVPADVASEQRTGALAQVLAGANIDAAFVGLRRKSGSAFTGVNGDSLDCTAYRAWAPGHPRRHRHQDDCVLLTRQRTWMSTPCEKTFSTLCELIPGGHYERVTVDGGIKEELTLQERSHLFNKKIRRNLLYALYVPTSSARLLEANRILNSLPYLDILYGELKVLNTVR